MAEAKKLHHLLLQELAEGGNENASSASSDATTKSFGNPARKITIVGVGQVGMACAYAILVQGYATEIALVDVAEDKLKGEMMDLQHGLALLKNIKISASSDYSISAHSDLCIITAGARQREGETRLNLVQRNLDIFKNIIPPLVKNSPNTILMVVSNPVDILTYVAWKLSGLPPTRVLGSGTTLDSSRFRFLLAQHLSIAPKSVHGWIIGEHGDSSVPVWSGVNVAGVPLRQILPSIGKGDGEGISDVAEKVKQAAYEIIKLKGYTSWSIGLCVSMLSDSILSDSHSVHPVSTFVKGKHGITQDVFLSLPAVLCRRGIREVVVQPLDDTESGQLRESASKMFDVQKDLKI